MFRTFALTTAAVLISASAASAQSSDQASTELKPLRIGDKAPAIDITHWVKGEPVKAFEEGTIYVVEFWATWCPPCRASMPHLTELQEKYKDYDVTVIGISDEDLPTVVKFLCSKEKEEKLWFDVVDYTLTTDPDRSAHQSYMNGVGAMGIPTSFIIGKDTRLEWVGHPMNMDKALEAVVKDNWDREAFAKEFEPQAQKNRERLAQMLAERAKAKPHQDALKKAVENKDVDAAIEALDALIALNPESPGPKMQKFQVLLTQFDASREAYAAGEELAKANWDNAMMLNQLAWFVADAPNIKSRNLDFAQKLANRALELEPDDAAILDTVARVYYEKGDLQNAVKHQKKAAENAPEGPMGDEIKANLQKYEDELAKKGS